jgi:hypothetical protein
LRVLTGLFALALHGKPKFRTARACCATPNLTLPGAFSPKLLKRVWRAKSFFFAGRRINGIEI